MGTQNVFEIDSVIRRHMSDESVGSSGSSAVQPGRPPMLADGAATAELDGSQADAAAAQRGRPAAFDQQDVERLIAQEYAGLRLLIARRAGDGQLGADLLHDAICVAWERWRQGELARPEQLAGYVFQVAMNMLRNQRRVLGDRPDRRARPAELDALASTDEPRENIAEAQVAARVKSLIRDLGSPRDRHVLVRLYLDEVDKKTLCREFELTPLQLDKMVHRARRRLLRLLESRGLKRSDFLCVLALL
jgi:RNA polymerase sigma factor (sigma-70 family)